ncbi:hypothetical protein D3H55_22520 [Bacillus salacetis]|uniref:Uncharacterized protein n=1 Tax=Bacillus salacetis TaxID=2315464 RepID=A0A3A1QPN6_9BACI|nr:hypothetical protein D3H55_22520 [Bacillus salacetis]
MLWCQSLPGICRNVWVVDSPVILDDRSTKVDDRTRKLVDRSTKVDDRTRKLVDSPKSATKSNCKILTPGNPPSKTI